MPYISPEVVARAKEVDLLTYLQKCEPGELISLGGNNYCTREHDSLKISNGMWYWFSHSIGGKTALDYLIKVKEMTFLDAVQHIFGVSAEMLTYRSAVPQSKQDKVLLLPHRCQSIRRVQDYLTGRGIDAELIAFCIRTGRLYESDPHHNAVFVGHDRQGKPRYANLRGTASEFKGECNGSDKRYSFNIPSPGSNTLHLFESAIDLLSYATLCKNSGRAWCRDHLLSLAGVYKPPKEVKNIAIPLSLSRYLEEHPEIHRIVLRLDRDYTGYASSNALAAALSGKYTVLIKPPPKGKDYNDFLCIEKGLIHPQKQSQEQCL